MKVTNTNHQLVRDDFIQSCDLEQSEESLDSLSSFFTTSSSSLDLFSGDDIVDLEHNNNMMKVKDENNDYVEVIKNCSNNIRALDNDKDTHNSKSNFLSTEYTICSDSSSQPSRKFDLSSTEKISNFYPNDLESFPRLNTNNDQEHKNCAQSLPNGVKMTPMQPLTPPSSPGKLADPMRISISVSTIPTTAPPSTCFIPVLASPNVNVLNEAENSTSSRSILERSGQTFQGNRL